MEKGRKERKKDRWWKEGTRVRWGFSGLKRFRAKAGIELMSKRGSTGGCYNNSATELDMKLGSSLEICRLYKIWSHSSGSQGPLNEFEQVLMITKLSPKVHGGSQTGGMLNFCELLEICNFRQAQAENSAENQLLHWFLKGILTFAQWISGPKTFLYKLH